MKKYTKSDIYQMIEETAEKSAVLRGLNIKNPWTINELIYCLELIDSRENDIMLDICNETTGISIPISSITPVWVDSHTRGQAVNIVDVEIEDGDYEGSPYIHYLIIVKEV